MPHTVTQITWASSNCPSARPDIIARAQRFVWSIARYIRVSAAHPEFQGAHQIRWSGARFPTFPRVRILVFRSILHARVCIILMSNDDCFTHSITFQSMSGHHYWWKIILMLSSVVFISVWNLAPDQRFRAKSVSTLGFWVSSYWMLTFKGLLPSVHTDLKKIFFSDCCNFKNTWWKVFKISELWDLVEIC